MVDPERFHYPLPEDEGSSRWGGLSPAAREVLSTPASGSRPADELLGAKSETVAVTRLSPEARSWAEQEVDGALRKWSQYREDLIMVPGSFDQFIEMNPNHAETLSRLFEIRKAISDMDEQTPEGMNVGDTMKLVLIPWADLQQDVQAQRFATWVIRWRQAQGKTGNSDDIAFSIMDAINDDSPLYRSPNNPAFYLMPSEYLQDQVGHNGLWGMMLAQTSNEAGVLHSLIESKSPDVLTGNGEQHLALGGHNVDAMGIFEWLALTLQEDPSGISARDSSLLLANRVSTQIGPQVPIANWEPGLKIVATRLTLALDGDDRNQPRLAVMDPAPTVITT